MTRTETPATSAQHCKPTTTSKNPNCCKANTSDNRSAEKAMTMTTPAVEITLPDWNRPVKETFYQILPEMVRNVVMVW